MLQKYKYIYTFYSLIELFENNTIINTKHTIFTEILNIYNNLIMTNKKHKEFNLSLILIGLLVIIPIVINFIIIFINKYNIYPANWNTFITYSLSFSLVLFISKKIWEITFFDIQRVNIIIFLLLIPITFTLSITIEGLSSLIPMPDKIQRLFEQMFSFDLPGYLTIGIMAPILEEFIFRGIVLKKFLKSHTPQSAIILSAIIFGIAHFNPWQFIGAFFMGILIGWIYWKTKSIWPGIFIHFTNNSLSFFIAKKYNNININFNDIINNNFYYTALLTISIITCYILIIILNKYLLKQNNNTNGYNQY